MKGHDRFESLAGALALGEATDDERAAFAAHAANCALCRQDLDLAASSSPLASLGAARDAETWRPTVDRALVARIRDQSAKRWRFTVGALGWGAALSIAINVAFVSGLTAEMQNALHPAIDAPPQVASFGIRLPARTFERVPKITYPKGLPLLAVSRGNVPKHVTARSFAATLAKAPAQAAASIAAQSADISDLLDANGAQSRRSVAVEITLPCTDGRTSSCAVVAHP